ncbi:ATP-binding protein [Oscillatoria sp. FACHB-1407]|uniref:AAA family ATPase n=1 Tax=Oscillatoria sp. FACHB-1407 TaxID=2692847 RepID=UPI001689AB16|nr:ATP-binding protein [Oscillatoria sp. FACHB-1407]MBD2462591.1 ATP-binding protein [Oscillatoria sp. FACHB-1407]
MPAEQPEGFIDNWTYLKTELSWLDRVLMVAVARQRNEKKDVDRIAQNRADRATSHWWKGLISTEGNAAYDEYRKPTTPTTTTSKQTYQQQLEAKIHASQKKGIVLGLPSLCDRLQLTVFEKNLVLMSLAPEINRRYARIYRFLQGEEISTKTDLPTVDLVLRLLCRSDKEWRVARNRLMLDSPLVRYNLLKILPRHEDTLLNYPLKLNDSLVDYLLSEQPPTEALDGLLDLVPQTPASRQFLTYTDPTVAWDDLIAPAPLVQALRSLNQAVQFEGDSLGVVALLVGADGSGKTTAAEAIATHLNTPLATLDLAAVEPEHYDTVFHEIAVRSPSVLLIQSAQHWLKRSTLASDVQIHQFLKQRRQVAGITLLTVSLLPSVQVRWQHQMDQILTFPPPDRGDRLKLWQHALNPFLETDSLDLDWEALAQPHLTGAEIRAIARTATALAATQQSLMTMEHLAQAFRQQGKLFKLKPVSKPSQAKRATRKTTPSKTTKTTTGRSKPNPAKPKRSQKES